MKTFSITRYVRIVNNPSGLGTILIRAKNKEEAIQKALEADVSEYDVDISSKYEPDFVDEVIDDIEEVWTENEK